jgi:acyl carrier protein
MKLVEFLELIAEALDCEETIVVEDNVQDIEGWDSLGILSIVSVLDELGMPVELEKFEEINTVQDFVTLVGFVDEQ